MKNLKKIISFFAIAIIVCSSCVIATTINQVPPGNEKGENNQEESIVYTSSKSVNFETEFYLIINLSKITYSKFEVEITNTSNLEAENITSAVSGLSTNGMVTKFIVDKENINLDKLSVVYFSPAYNSIINFSVKLTNLDTTELDEMKAEVNVISTEIKSLQDDLTELKSSLEGIENKESEEYINLTTKIDEIEGNLNEKNELLEQIEIGIENYNAGVLKEDVSIVVTEDSDTASDNPFADKEMMDKEMMNKEMSEDMKKMKEQMSNLESNLKDANDKITSLTKTETYQGSQNNYLESLSIEGVEFENSFKKTMADYFASVEEDVNDVTVKATAEDSSAIVTIYGNTDLHEGKNKILINVTADDGSVRTYRIYVTK